jgi:hypothetical protein
MTYVFFSYANAITGYTKEVVMKVRNSWLPTTHNIEKLRRIDSCHQIEIYLHLSRLKGLCHEIFFEGLK